MTRFYDKVRKLEIVPERVTQPDILHGVPIDSGSWILNPVDGSDAYALDADAYEASVTVLDAAIPKPEPEPEPEPEKAAPVKAAPVGKPSFPETLFVPSVNKR